jgi:hypothetical protein
MTVEFDEEVLDRIFSEVDEKQATRLRELFIALVDEEHQVRHLIRAHSIIRRIDARIDEHLEVNE